MALLENANARSARDGRYRSKGDECFYSLAGPFPVRADVIILNELGRCVYFERDDAYLLFEEKGFRKVFRAGLPPGGLCLMSRSSEV
jgi:hypothetical protein